MKRYKIKKDIKEKDRNKKNRAKERTNETRRKGKKLCPYLFLRGRVLVCRQGHVIKSANLSYRSQNGAVIFYKPKIVICDLLKPCGGTARDHELKL